MQNRLAGVAFKVGRWHAKLHAFAKQLMGMAHHKYACTQTCEVEVCFTTKINSQRPTKRICNYTKSQQIDHKYLLFAHFIIADINSELKNCTFTEIAPHSFYPLYGNSLRLRAFLALVAACKCS